MAKGSENRWWEFYGVRYAMGTVIGTIVVFSLFRSNPHLCHLLFLPEPIKEFGMAHLVLLAVYGLTCCYLASAPILALYTSRPFLNVKRGSGSLLKRPIFLVCAIALIISFGITGIFFGYFGENIWRCFIAVIFFALVVVQLIPVVASVRKSTGEKAAIYSKKLAGLRSQTENQEYVESYRHLREHGNSFLIVFFELFLGLVLFTFVNSAAMLEETRPADVVLQRIVMILVFWILPAMLVWVVGLRQEHYLVRGE